MILKKISIREKRSSMVLLGYARTAMEHHESFLSGEKGRGEKKRARCFLPPETCLDFSLNTNLIRQDNKHSFNGTPDKRVNLSASNTCPSPAGIKENTESSSAFDVIFHHIPLPTAAPYTNYKLQECRW